MGARNCGFSNTENKITLLPAIWLNWPAFTVKRQRICVALGSAFIRHEYKSENDTYRDKLPLVERFKSGLQTRESPI